MTSGFVPQLHHAGAAVMQGLQAARQHPAQDNRIALCNIEEFISRKSDELAIIKRNQAQITSYVGRILMQDRDHVAGKMERQHLHDIRCLTAIAGGQRACDQLCCATGNIYQSIMVSIAQQRLSAGQSLVLAQRAQLICNCALRPAIGQG